MSVERVTSLLLMMSVFRSRALKTPMPGLRQQPMELLADDEPRALKRLEKMSQVAVHGDADARGQPWYDDKDSSLVQEDVFKESSESFSSLDVSMYSKQKSDCKPRSEKGSSAETDTKEIMRQLYRQCVACPQDMLKKYTNVGIKWICGGYQRARRSFKSECMMRYRNCQDGTMFVKISNTRCKKDKHHGRHFFYLYGV